MTTDDRALAEQAAQGSHEAFAQLVDQYEKKIYNLTLRMVNSREDAADLTQEIFLRIWRGLPDWRGQSSLSTWIYRLACNVCIDFLRRQKKRRTLPLTAADADAEEWELPLPDPAPGPEQRAMEQETREALTRALAELPDQAREILVLRAVEGLSYEQIAEILGLREGTVKSRLSRAREKLRKQMIKNGNRRGGTSSEKGKG